MDTEAANLTGFPDGLGDQHLRPDESVRRHASILSLTVLGVFMALGLSGLLGGGLNSRLEVRNDQVALVYAGPTTLRNGMLFEAHVLVTAVQPIEKLTISIEPPLVHDLTMNTMVPAPAEETFEDEAFRFAYDKLDQGDRFDLKIDFQINPSLFKGTYGRIKAYDGDKLLAEIPVTITVLP